MTSALAAAKQTARLRAESGQRSLLWRLLWTAWVLQLLEESPFLQNQEEHIVKWPTALNHCHREGKTSTLPSHRTYTWVHMWGAQASHTVKAHQISRLEDSWELKLTALHQLEREPKLKHSHKMVVWKNTRQTEKQYKQATGTDRW